MLQVRMFLPSPVPLVPGKFYMLTALIQGTESFCGEDCMEVGGGAGCLLPDGFVRHDACCSAARWFLWRSSC